MRASWPSKWSKLDVADEAAVSAFAGDLAGRIDGLDALVNAAGVQTYGTIETTPPADWQKSMAVNLTACYLTSHFLYPLMKRRGEGAIVHIASVQGHANQNNVLAYATAKGAVHTLTRAMAVDCARDGIRVNSVSPRFRPHSTARILRPLADAGRAARSRRLWRASDAPIRSAASARWRRSLGSSPISSVRNRASAPVPTSSSTAASRRSSASDRRRASHARVVRPAAALRRHPVDVLVGVLDVAGLAVDAVAALIW